MNCQGDICGIQNPGSDSFTKCYVVFIIIALVIGSWVYHKVEPSLVSDYTRTKLEARLNKKTFICLLVLKTLVVWIILSQWFLHLLPKQAVAACSAGKAWFGRRLKH